MLSRVVLAGVAVAVLAWVGVLVRDVYVTRIARPFIDPNTLSARQFETLMRRTHEAELLNPDPAFQLARARFLLLRGRPRDAAREAEALVRDEPANHDAWVVLLQATSRFDRARAAQAAVRIRRLNPLAGAGAQP